MELVRVTEAAAMASAEYIGTGDKKGADQAATDAMRRALNCLDIDGTIVIGEGERDEAPMLYIGEKVGTGTGMKIDIAVDPLEGTDVCARGAENSISVIAAAEHGKFLHAPDVYMEKLALGAGYDISKFDLDMPADAVVREVARQKGVPVNRVMVCMLDRERHQPLMAGVRKAGARIKLIGDGDVAGAIAAVMPDSGIDVLLGSGGAPEGVLAAAALRCMGGNILGRLVFKNDAQIERAQSMGVRDPKQTFTTTDMASGEVMFAATGVTSGTFLQGVTEIPGGCTSHSLVMRSKTGTIRKIETFHRDSKFAEMMKAAS
ncbi:MAG: class II fructose-bisphosphatase [Proteobacteria bacterium]|nr:class II fructose-bisphosphatase [Pseudomonadota bacterium]